MVIETGWHTSARQTHTDQFHKCIHFLILQCNQPTTLGSRRVYIKEQCVSVKLQGNHWILIMSSDASKNSQCSLAYMNGVKAEC